MKKKVAKLFKKYGEGEIKVLKKYSPKSKRDVTTAIETSRLHFNKAIGNILLKGKKEEQKLVGEALQGNFFEDWSSEDKTIIKY